MNRAAFIFLACATFAAASLTIGTTAAQELLWSQGETTATAVPSQIDPLMRHVEIRRAGSKAFTSRNGYLATSIEILWKRGDRPTGPDLVVGGHTGGNHCCAEIVSFDFTGDVRIQTMAFGNTERLTIGDTEGIPHFTARFDVAGFNSAQSSVANVLFPIVWEHGRFDVELAKLIKPMPAASALRADEEAMRDELNQWAFRSYPAPGHSAAAPKTVQTLLTLILRGHGDEARSMLARAWPVWIEGREIYWRDLSTAVVRHRLWTQFDLARIPHADTILTAADRK